MKFARGIQSAMGIKEDIEGSKPKVVHKERLDAEFNSLSVAGVDGCVAKKRVFKPRVIDTAVNEEGAAGPRQKAIRGLANTP